jgi:hypothetical protein
MVSGARTLVRTPIGSGLLLFPGAAHDRGPARCYPARPIAGSRSILVQATGPGNARFGALVSGGIRIPSLRIASFGRDNSIPSALLLGGYNSNPRIGFGRVQLNPLASVPGGNISNPRVGAGRGQLNPPLRCGEVAEWQTRTVQVRVPERA